MDKTLLSDTPVKPRHAFPFQDEEWEALNVLSWVEGMSHSWDLDIWMASVYG